MLADKSGYAFGKESTWLADTKNSSANYYDTYNGKHVFTSPVGRSYEEFIKESRQLGYLSFRDDEVNWDNVRVVLWTADVVTTDGAPLGKMSIDPNDKNRYTINLSAISGNPKSA